MDRSLKALWKRAPTTANDGDDSKAVLKRLDERGRELLLSTGSLTATIESLLSTHLSVEVVESPRELTCDATLAEYLGVAEGTLLLEREVRLSAEGRRVLYAKSLFSLKGIERPVLEEILESNEPLGRSLGALGVSFKKDMLEIALIDDATAAICGLGGPASKGPLACRRYRLFSAEGSKININAALIEVFARELIEVK